METNFDEEFNEFMGQIGKFLVEKGYRTDSVGPFCAATIAAWSLKHEQSKLNTLVKNFKRKEAQDAIMRYADYYKDLQVIAAGYGREIIDYGIKNLGSANISTICKELMYMENYGYLNELLLELHHLESNDFYIEYGCGTGNSLLKLAAKGITACGIDRSLEAIIIAEIKSYWKNIDIHVVHTNMDYNDIKDVKANKSTVDTAFLKNGDNFEALMQNEYLQPYKAVIKKSGMRVWSQAIIAYQKNKDGRVIALATPAALFNNADKELRKTLINQGIIEGIIELPAGVLACTNIAPVILILSKGNHDGMKMMDASDCCVKTAKDVFIEPLQIEEIVRMYDAGIEKCQTISKAEIMENNYILGTNFYFNKSVVKNGVALIDVCKIERGATVKAEELAKLTSDMPTDYQYLMLQDIVDGKIANQLPYIRTIDKKYRDAVLVNNDIVISKLTPFKICLVHVEDGKKILANGNLFRLTVDPKKMNPVYVMLFLSSPDGQQELSKYIKGTAMRTISIKDLNKVQIPDIDRAKQDKIAAKYTTLMSRLEEIDIERQKVLSEISKLV